MTNDEIEKESKEVYNLIINMRKDGKEKVYLVISDFAKKIRKESETGMKERCARVADTYLNDKEAIINGIRITSDIGESIRALEVES
jgi:hypothetical protein